MRRIAEPDAGQIQLAAAFHEHAVRSVDHDIGDAVVLQQRLQRPEAEHVVHQFLGQQALFAAVEMDAFLGGDFRDQPFHFRGQALERHGGDGGRIEPGEAQRAQFVERRRRPLGDRRRRGCGGWRGRGCGR